MPFIFKDYHHSADIRYLLSGDRLILAGSLFRGVSEASGGGTNDSATDYPLVQLRRIDNEQVIRLAPDPAHPFSATSFTSSPLGTLANGHYLETISANAIPGISVVTRFGPLPSPPPGHMGAMQLLLLD